jgi:hypothetical protein
MRATRLSLVAFAAAGLISTGAFAQSQSQSNQGASGAAERQQQSDRQDRQGQSSAQARPGQGSDQAPEGFVLIEERFVAVTANEPQNHFLRAHEYLTKNDPRGAAGEIRIAAEYMDMQASRDQGQSKQQLARAADELRKTADQLAPRQQGDHHQAENQTSGQSGQQSARQSAQHAGGQSPGQSGQASSDQPQQQQQLMQAFARADHALAEHFAEQAKSEIGSHKAIMAGHDVQAAADSLNAAFVWSGQQKPEEKAQTAITDARRLAEQLLMAEGQSSSGQAQGQSAAEAQQAAAKTGPGQANQAQSGRIPADASKTIDELTTAIQQTANQFGQAGQSSQQTDQSGTSHGGQGAQQPQQSSGQPAQQKQK